MKSMFALFSTKVALGTAATLMVGVVAPSASYAAALTPVDLELWLGVDVSGSVDSSEFSLQRQGYVNAFKSSNVQNLITKATSGIAVGYGYWSSSNEQNVAVGWTLLKTAADANSFADAIAATARPFSGLTGIGAAINFGANQIGTNDYEGTKKVIDISGDGTNNSGVSPASARDAAAALGITINGLPILGSEANLDTYYQNNVVTADGFVVPAASFADFNAAIEKKLTLEIGEVVPPAAVPTPALLPGLLGMGVAALRKRGQEEGESAEA